VSLLIFIINGIEHSLNDWVNDKLFGQKSVENKSYAYAIKSIIRIAKKNIFNKFCIKSANRICVVAMICGIFLILLSYFCHGHQVKSDRKVIVDCDAGVDDIYAIQVLLNDPNVNLIAITTYAFIAGRTISGPHFLTIIFVTLKLTLKIQKILLRHFSVKKYKKFVLKSLVLKSTKNLC